MSANPFQDAANLAADARLVKEHPEWAAFIRWARAQQANYEQERAAWRRQNPLVDVKALEDAYGITQETLSIEQLRQAAVPLIIGRPNPEEP